MPSGQDGADAQDYQKVRVQALLTRIRVTELCDLVHLNRNASLTAGQ